MPESENRFVKGLFFLLLFFSIVLLGTLLKIMDSFFKPVILAALMSFVLYPAVKKLNLKLKMPWWLSIIVVFLIFFTFMVLITNLLTVSFKSIIFAIPRYEQRFQDIYRMLKEAGNTNTGSKFLLLFDFDADESLFRNIQNQFDIFSAVKNFAINFTGSVVGFTKVFFLVLLMSIFMLTEMRQTKNKISRAFSSHERIRVHTILQNIIKDVTHYISIKFVISIITGVLATLICLLTGMDFPLIWGFLAFALNFIPTFGSIISTGITVLFAVLQFYPSIFVILFILVSMTAMNIFLGNILEPRIEGENLGISPLVILVSLSFWGWLWGILGMILAVPFVVIIKIVCENVTFLKPIAVLLGNKA